MITLSFSTLARTSQQHRIVYQIVSGRSQPLNVGADVLAKPHHGKFEVLEVEPLTLAGQLFLSLLKAGG
jgi:hypothetical protein